MNLELKQVTKSFGTINVVPPIDLSIKQGEFIVLLGPSGCGKSTILRMIAGLEDVTSGSISIDGRVVNDVPPKDRDLAMVFQSYALYPHMSVFDNMGFGLKMRAFPEEEIKSRVLQAAKYLDLEKHLYKKPSALSGGQRQRVAMGRALVRRPKIFLFDEPLSNLDAQLRIGLRSEIKRLHHEVNATTIYVTHDQEEAMSLADRIIILRHGRVEQQGSPLDIFTRPKNLFVAEFLGSPRINLLDKEVRGQRVGIGKLELPVDTDGRVRVGIRPGDISFYPKDRWVEGGAFKVRYAENLGDSTLVHGLLDQQPVIMLTNTKRVPQSGEHPCYINPQNVGLFHQETGLLLN
ncbi:ABC transporter ATP-binding protein [Pseudobacteriovorax antillogorgiicola]|uniref:Carbohydrate ABC transporter ATP-binding protein, CUT1 family n=1 Tax=Pseudobacteriovorax antillogorgiicola TaxID=1513793 RepID=A0A1Y6BGG5_9BACT|nr:ABC transporter ATP-binding protein [Pseudobacteriovorax antillogorgiicola]TCS57356.1 carbohydrate ABC transporter ATP-binding protein (CUT1 family) [Pseudobacteriovorax antillogorgiicola]SMF02053.1 carbohydrate ABC transporter ATP-binding protein, CUT1 family [Pseudobacteriovorax antillogorgiicola]